MTVKSVYAVIIKAAGTDDQVDAAEAVLVAEMTAMRDEQKVEHEGGCNAKYADGSYYAMVCFRDKPIADDFDKRITEKIIATGCTIV